MQALPQRPNELVLSVQLGEQLSLKIAPCPARPVPAGSWGSDPGSPSRRRPAEPGEPGEPRTPPLRAWPGPIPEAELAGAALSPQVPRRVEGPRARARPARSGMGAGGTASRALAWASLPLLGPPAGALGGDTLGCRGKARPRRACALLFPGTRWGLFLLPHASPQAGGRGEMGGGGTGRRRGTPGISGGLERRA